MNSAATAGTIALPAPRNKPTPPGSLAAKGKSEGSAGILLCLPSWQGQRVVSPFQCPSPERSEVRCLFSSVKDLHCFWNLGLSGSPIRRKALFRIGPYIPDAETPFPAWRSPSPLLWATPLTSLIAEAPTRPVRAPRRLCDSELWPRAIHHSRWLMCGAPTPAAHRSAAPTTYPIASRSRHTPESQSLPAGDATCSPNVIAGFRCEISHLKAGHRCRSSSVPLPFPAALNGWQGQLPVQTSQSSGTPAILSARLQPPIPAKR